MSIFLCYQCENLRDADDGCEDTADGYSLICIDCMAANEAEAEEAPAKPSARDRYHAFTAQWPLPEEYQLPWVVALRAEMQAEYEAQRVSA